MDWIIYHKKYVNVYRYGWIKSTTQFYTVWGVSPINNLNVFLCGRDRHFFDHTLSYPNNQYIQPFVLKPDSYGNQQLNEIFPNEKLKSIYNGVKEYWILKYQMKLFYLATWNKSGNIVL